MGVVEQPSGTVRMGVDVGGSSIKWVVVDDDRIIERGRRSTPATSRADVLGAVARLAFAIAEWKLGAAHGHDNVVAVTLGTGLGCGIVVDGRLIRGPGELGHVKVNDSGTPCGCGATGCLETVASASGMVRQAREAIARGESTSLDALRDELTAKALPVIRATIGERAAIIGDCRVVVSSLGLHAGAIGAALWKENT